MTAPGRNRLGARRRRKGAATSIAVVFALNVVGCDAEPGPEAMTGSQAAGGKNDSTDPMTGEDPSAARRMEIAIEPGTGFRVPDEFWGTGGEHWMIGLTPIEPRRSDGLIQVDLWGRIDSGTSEPRTFAEFDPSEGVEDLPAYAGTLTFVAPEDDPYLGDVGGPYRFVLHAVEIEACGVPKAAPGICAPSGVWIDDFEEYFGEDEQACGLALNQHSWDECGNYVSG